MRGRRGDRRQAGAAQGVRHGGPRTRRRNTPDTIFEAGSVSKQFTALAVLLLANDGKLSLDDPVRKYIPELPDYGVPLTIRHMLTTPAGFATGAAWRASRDGRGRRAAHARACAGDRVAPEDAELRARNAMVYSNTGFNLAAIIVSRVSGMPFAEFTRKRIFTPLGMTHTSWRDDHTRIVKGRAIAYSEPGRQFHNEMPFENVHGNGGLLTTVGDLLKWNENFVDAESRQSRNF